MFTNLLSKIKSWDWRLITVLGMWILVWAGYNTGIERVANPGFPHGVLDLAHGLRAFLPIAAGIATIIFLVAKKQALPFKFLLTPCGLLLLYAFAGIISSVLSNHVVFALYWAAMFGAVLLVLLAHLWQENTKALDCLAWIIKSNWVIAGLLAFGLLVYFLAQPGVFSSLTLNFLVCVKRPYEGLGTITAGLAQFGVAASRPTGFGRYAGIAAIAAFVAFLQASPKKKLLPLLLFSLFAALVFFSKGKTEIIAFMVSLAGIAIILKKYTLRMAALFVVMAVLAAAIVFLNIPCANPDALLGFFIRSNHAVVEPGHVVVAINPAPASSGSPVVASAPAPAPAGPTTQPKNIKSLVTLSGRTDGIWKDSWNLFLSEPLIGRGFQADRYFLGGQHAHNTVLHALVQTGLIGTLLFIAAFCWAIYMLLRLLKNPVISHSQKIFLVEIAAVMIFLLVRGITESLAFYSADWLFMAPLIAYIQVLYFSNPLNHAR